MAIEMIDIKIAERISAQLVDGELVTVVIDGVTSQRKLHSHTFYGLTIDGLHNKLTIPIEMTEAYRKEVEKMARTPMPGQTARGRGRPPKGESQAPVEHPTARRDDTPPGGWLPPGSTGAGPTVPGLARDVSNALQSVGAETAYEPFTPPGTAPASRPSAMQEDGARAEAAQTLLPQPDTLTLSDMIHEAFGNFGEELNIIVNQFETKLQETKTEQAEIPMTCMNCENVDPDTWQCGKFKCNPPINVVADAKNMCPDFIESDPFA